MADTPGERTVDAPPGTREAIRARRVMFDEAAMIEPTAIAAITAMGRAGRVEATQQQAEDEEYPIPGAQPSDADIIALEIDGKVAKIAPSREKYKDYEVVYGESVYHIDLMPIQRVTKALVICLAQHAIRLKRDITFLTNRNDVMNLEIDLNSKEILIVRFDTEHFSVKVTRIKHLELPNYKVKLDEIEPEIGRRMRVYAQPEDKEKIGHEFKDLKNNVIAYMSSSYGTVMLLWNALAWNTTPMEPILAYLNYILTNYSGKCDEVKIKATEKIEQEREKKRKIEYTHFIDQMYRESIYAIQHKMERNQSDIDTHMRGLYSKGKELSRDVGFLQKLKDRSNSKEIKTQLETDYKLIIKLRKTNKYTNFRFDAGSIVGQTSMIKFFNKYEIGKFDVYLSLNGVVKCHNKTYVFEGYDHPHVSNGNPCWGNLGDAVFRMLRSNQFGAAFDMMYEFLLRYNDGKSRDGMNRPYQLLEKWKPAFLQQGLVVCSVCTRIKELCHCGQESGGEPGTRTGIRIAGHCGNCGQSLDGCGCARCPAESDNYPENVIGVDCDCSHDCDHWDEDEQICAY